MRKLEGTARKVLYVYIVLVGAFHIFTSLTGAFGDYSQRVLHLCLILPLAFALWPAGRKEPTGRIPWYDALLALLCFAPGAFILATGMDQPQPSGTAWLAFGALLILLLIEAARRVAGLPLALISVAALLYMLFGSQLPGGFQAGPQDISAVIGKTFLGMEGIFSTPLGVSSTYVIIFFIFGGFLEKTGVASYFMDLAKAFSGAKPGGPALVAITSSCLFGSISGSAEANVYGTGTTTIPLMKNVGYPAHVAGAVEAVASTGGQIMPPVMGAGAFLMAAFLGLPYRIIMISAILPALMYYGAIFLMVKLGADKHSLKGLAADELPARSAVLKKLYMIIPLAGIVYFLMTGSSPIRAALMGIILCWIISFFGPEAGTPPPRKIKSCIAGSLVSALFGIGATFPGLSERATGTPIGIAALLAAFLIATLFNAGMGFKGIFQALHAGTEGIPSIAIVCAACGIALGAFSGSHLDVRFADLLLSLTGNQRLLGLVIIMMIPLILGMGMSATGAYILSAALGAPVLTGMGISALAAHMFIFYFSVMSDITPPVAFAAAAAGSISGAPTAKIGFQAMRLGFLAFIVPFAFCYDPGILLQGTLAENLWAVVAGSIAIFAFGYSWMGYIKRPIPIWLRFLLFLAGVYSLFPGTLPVVASGIVTAGCFLFSRYAPVVKNAGAAS